MDTRPRIVGNRLGISHHHHRTPETRRNPPLEIHAASGARTASTIRALSADFPGIDAYALMRLGSSEVDWAAANAVWRAFYSLWPVLPHDDGSGFDVDMDELELAAAEADRDAPSSKADLDTLFDEARRTAANLLLNAPDGTFAPFALILGSAGKVALTTPDALPADRPSFAIVNHNPNNTADVHLQHHTGEALKITAPYVIHARSQRRVVWLGTHSHPTNTL
ncbi:hypothetical protein ACFQHO_25645 [Actinomadura yumaensis]|uniref:hypothetical protein n=1 Tax=Actinomadura TaxID=1988 RepID=UPI00132134FB|nr:hypothetical protein [Actinomadura sp. J1-007]MWK34632.1 hypothetical protein [Actinomadura sp. J1-007]